jgi:hypothetical protein
LGNTFQGGADRMGRGNRQSLLCPPLCKYAPAGACLERDFSNVPLNATVDRRRDRWKTRKTLLGVASLVKLQKRQYAVLGAGLVEWQYLGISVGGPGARVRSLVRNRTAAWQGPRHLRRGPLRRPRRVGNMREGGMARERRHMSGTGPPAWDARLIYGRSPCTYVR